jgi:glycosyltransferase involved in cell wall biosynthesis
MKITGFMTIKNEWPLVAVSISHALINHVDRMYVVDNGSTDGTWEGLKILQEIFPDRLVVIYYESEYYDQKAISHALGHLGSDQGKQPHWALSLDADEFLIKNFPETLKEYIERASSEWHSIVLDVVNYIPPQGFQDDDLDLYPMIEYKVRSYSQSISAEEFKAQAEAGKLYWQQYKTGGKVTYKMELHKRLGHGSHQIDYGDAIRYQTHDSGTASLLQTDLLYVAHLPYTSLKRLSNRTQLRHTESPENPFRFFRGANIDDLSDAFANATIDKSSQLFSDSLATEIVVMDNRFSESVKSVIHMLEPRWNELVSAPYVKSESNDQTFGSLVGMAAEYIEILDKLWLGDD